GDLQQTDASGNILGSLHPTDWVMQISASRSYLEKWDYGGALKFINSNYGVYCSSGIAADPGVLFHDTAHLFSASVVARYMGFQIKKYAGSDGEDLPFDLVAGIAKRLEHAPLGLSVNAQHLHQVAI